MSKRDLPNIAAFKRLQTAQEDSFHPLAVLPDCKLIESLLALLSTFFGNGSLTNLLITEVILSLASCDRIALHGWLIPLPEAGSKTQCRM